MGFFHQAQSSPLCQQVQFDYNLEKNKNSFYLTLDELLAHCPDQLLTKFRPEDRHQVKAILNYNLKRFEDIIIENSKYKNVDSDWKKYLSINQVLKQNQISDLKGLQAYVDLARTNSQQRKKQCGEIVNWKTSLSVPSNQNRLNWCYAYTLGDMISYKKNKTVSASDIAIQNNSFEAGKKASLALKNYINNQQLQKGNGLGIVNPNEIKSYNYETHISGGRIDTSFERLKKQGVCLESDLPSNHITDEYLRNYDELIKMKDKLDGMDKKCDYSEIKNNLSPLPSVKLTEAIQLISTTNENNLIKSLVDKNCENKRISVNDLNLKTIKFSSQQNKTGDGIFESLNQQLENDNIVGIAYDAAIFGNDFSGGHASTIIGRTFNDSTQECEYIIRNSWGTNTNNNTNVYNKDGYYFVPQSKLKKHIWEISYFE